MSTTTNLRKREGIESNAHRTNTVHGKLCLNLYWMRGAVHSNFRAWETDLGAARVQELTFDNFEQKWTIRSLTFMACLAAHCIRSECDAEQLDSCGWFQYTSRWPSQGNCWPWLL